MKYFYIKSNFKYKLGAIIDSKIKLTKDEILHVAVGQKGNAERSGSGGSFIVRQRSDGSFEPLVIAGGAGGDYWKKKTGWCSAQLDEFGNGEEPNMEIGSSGLSGHSDRYNGGAGFKRNRPNRTEDYPKCFEDGLVGGNLDYR